MEELDRLLMKQLPCKILLSRNISFLSAEKEEGGDWTEWSLELSILTI